MKNEHALETVRTIKASFSLLQEGVQKKWEQSLLALPENSYLFFETLLLEHYGNHVFMDYRTFSSEQKEKKMKEHLASLCAYLKQAHALGHWRIYPVQDAAPHFTETTPAPRNMGEFLSFRLLASADNLFFQALDAAFGKPMLGWVRAGDTVYHPLQLSAHKMSYWHFASVNAQGFYSPQQMIDLPMVVNEKTPLLGVDGLKADHLPYIKTLGDLMLFQSQKNLRFQNTPLDVQKGGHQWSWSFLMQKKAENLWDVWEQHESAFQTHPSVVPFFHAIKSGHFAVLQECLNVWEKKEDKIRFNRLVVWLQDKIDLLQVLEKKSSNEGVDALRKTCEQRWVSVVEHCLLEQCTPVAAKGRLAKAL